MMVSIDMVKEIAISLPGTVEQQHWGRPAYKAGKKIYATVWPLKMKIVVMLDPVQQSVYTDAAPGVFIPVEGGWGKKGATYVDLLKVKKNVCKEVLKVAWSNATN
ncbi:MAG: MmcQ/YjbR family DNA-binding protein [Ferruginibacter sp.]